MRAVIETTDWADVGDAINHVYLLDGDTCLAYIPHGTKDIRFLTTPIRLDRRGRTFQELKFNPFQKAAPAKSHIRRVQGSKGQVYEVNTRAGTCTCPGFTFRGHCRHVEAAQAA